MSKTALLLLAALFIEGRTQGQMIPLETPAVKELSVVDLKLIEAREYLECGLYDIADKRCRQVLALDPDNDAAAQGRELIKQARKDFAAMNPDRTGDTDSFFCPETHWQLPCDSPQETARINRVKASSAMEKRLTGIVIPPMDFASTPLREVVAWLQTEARRSDANHDPALGDVEILTRFLPLPTSKISDELVPSTNPGIPGLPPGAEPASQSYVPPPPTTESTLVTLKMSQGSLLTALQELAMNARMHVRLETGKANLIFGGSDPDDLMHIVSIRVPPSFISSTPEDGSLHTQDTEVDARTFLESSGVTFPPGAKAVYIRGVSRLIVRNTQPNLDLVLGLCAP